jgi:hypothetical protein
MKKALLTSLFLLLAITAALAYETIIIKYPPGELWVKAYYRRIGNEAILQYVPNGQSNKEWKRSIIVHSYYESAYPIRNFTMLELQRMLKTNPTGRYRYLKMNERESMVTRCTDNYKDVKAQCEFFRITHVHNGIVTLHYINRDKENFMDNYKEWLDIIWKAKYYNSYYRDERTFDKSEYFELWDD